MSLTPGTRLGACQIVAPLGAGGMGEVYRATDTTLGREVAIMVLPDAVAADEGRVARFEREARTLATLNHPHIAQVYGLERSPSTGSGQAGAPALVMEDWSGSGILYVTIGNPGQADLYALPSLDGAPYALLDSEFTESEAVLSPDGRWLAYHAAMARRQPGALLLRAGSRCADVSDDRRDR